MVAEQASSRCRSRNCIAFRNRMYSFSPFAARTCLWMKSFHVAVLLYEEEQGGCEILSPGWL